MKLLLTTILLLVSLSLKAPPLDYKYYFSNIKIWYNEYLTQLEWNKYMLDMRIAESSNNYNYVSKKSKYFSAYQFSEKLLHRLGYNVTKKEFSKNPAIFNPNLQDEAFIRLCNLNAKYMSKYLKKYNNRYINDVLINKAGILAACHLAGPSNVKKYLISNGKRDFKDGNGTRVSSYIKQFNKYNI